MPKLQPVDDTFFTTAPSRFEETFRIARPAAEVWAELASDRPLHWCRVLSIRWTSDRPFAVGTTRLAKVFGGAISIKEHFFNWDEGRRMSFYATSGNLPLFRRLAEDYVVEPDGDAACRFTWRAGIEPTALGRPGGPLNAFVFKTAFADTRKYFSAT
jgi:hypothetical protein